MVGMLKNRFRTNSFLIFHQLPLLLWFWVFSLHLCEEIPPIALTFLPAMSNSRTPTEVDCWELRKKLDILKNCQMCCQPKNCWEIPLRGKIGKFCVQCRNNLSVITICIFRDTYENMTKLNVYLNSCSSAVGCTIGCGMWGYLVLTPQPKRDVP